MFASRDNTYLQITSRLTFQQAIDVGQALEVMLHDDATASQTYELYGPTNYSMAEIAALVDREIMHHRRHINIPKRIGKPLANILNRVLWWPTTSPDEIEREFIDQTIDPTAKTFADLGIEPAELNSLTFHYLVSAPCLLREANGARLNRENFPNSLTNVSGILARVPVKRLLRPSSCYGEGEAGGKEILACPG